MNPSSGKFQLLDAVLTALTVVGLAVACAIVIVVSGILQSSVM